LFSQRRASLGSENEEGEKKRNKYAFVAAEILSSDNWSIYEALMESKHLLRDFWRFLKRPTPLDPLQASYFTKVNESLFDKKTEEMLDLLKSLDNAVPDMIMHVDSPMVMDLLLKIISLERTDAGQGVVEWLYTQDVMPTLLSFLGPEHSWATQTSAGDFMKAIITVSANASQNEQTCIGPNELTRQLVSKPCVDQLIQYMLGGGNPLTVGVGIIIEVIRKNNSDYDPEVGQEQNTAPPSSRDPIYLGTLLRRFADHVPDFMRLIMNAPSQKERLPSTFGDTIEKLGFDRFKTCELMAELLHCSNMGLLNEPGAEEIITARDVERRRLRDEGRLAFAVGSVPSSADDLTMRSMARSSSPEESRKLGVTNVSNDDEGFEEITHAAEGDTSHGSQGDEDMPDLPPIGDITPPSFLDKDEDFVDEPLNSSPRLNVRDIPKKDHEDSFEDPELMVPPLSPTKKVTSEVEKMDAMTLGEPATHVDEGGKAGEDAKGGHQDFALSNSDHPMEGASMTSQESSGTEELAPRPEDTPAPLFSNAVASTESSLRGDHATPTSSGDVSADKGGPDAPKNTEDSGASVNVGHSTEQEEASMSTTSPPVVGDYLKTQFVENGVVPTILSFFFKYPWNNFLHNVVYDIVQQVFNGPMDRGYNSVLAISLFEQADITAQIIKGQQTSELSQAQARTRMGYMGHLTLIAEEVVKFTDRHPPELLSATVLDRVMAPEWCSYVDGALAETRERDNAILGGVRPEVAMNRPGAGGSSLAAAGLANIGLSGLAGGSGLQSASSALAEAGLDGGSSAGPFAISAGTLMSGFGSSSDEDDDEEQDNDDDVQNEYTIENKRVLRYPRPHSITGELFAFDRTVPERDTVDLALFGV
jgi:SIT4-associating protein SAP185/190